MITIKDFVVLKSLRVCDIEVTPQRVSAKYEIVHPNGNVVAKKLYYTYSSPLFDKRNIEDLNLASMMVAQVAMNYGLFCSELIFEGHFDSSDQEFIRRMVENTSKEILTNKLLTDNPFITEAYRGMKAEKNDRYTQAEIVFPRKSISLVKRHHGRIKPDYSQYAILSSGGKDSLLSYGLIKEFGTPHPLFVNEAGRHWYTAVNAYRHFIVLEPNTEKVWCNSDRIFNWMVKNLSFIRRDYASIRADIYPIRLWTVAVFLFGVLPFALKRGLGNVIIGDEYDTTIRKTTEGISHYAALYDQSKYFDHALTRFYQKKGWDLFQYSILRSTSELLIMKVLLKRYPELQRHQMSCHAAHEENKRMYPCGNCEKCRRIIGMILALEESPEHCGYTPSQINKALHRLANASVKQIGSDVAQLYYQLLNKGHIERNSFTQRLARARPSVMQLRFDKERSSLEDLPEHVRKPLFNILLEYSNGAVIKNGQEWTKINIDDAFLKSIPYKYGSIKSAQ